MAKPKKTVRRRPPSTLSKEHQAKVKASDDLRAKALKDQHKPKATATEPDAATEAEAKDDVS